MIQQISIAIIFAACIVFPILWFMDCIINKHSEDDCTHEFTAKYQSKGIEQCIDCLEEMPLSSGNKFEIRHQR